MTVKDKIMSIEIGKSIDLTKHSNMYISVQFSKDIDGEYIWTLYRKGYAGPIFPMQSTWAVKTFKTLNGCKRNFLRRIVNSLEDII